MDSLQINIKNSIMNSLLHWFSDMSVKDVDKSIKFKKLPFEEQMMMNINRYYDKYKEPYNFGKVTKINISKTLEKIRKVFEFEMSKKNEDGSVVELDNGRVDCVPFSLMLLVLLTLDRLINVENDVGLRVAFSHIDFVEFYKEIEKEHLELFNSTNKILHKLLD